METRELVKIEKSFTAKILKNLVIIDREKLFSDYGFSSLYHYLIKGLGYSEGEAQVRVSAVKLLRKDDKIISQIESGSLSLSNAAQVNVTLDHVSKKFELTQQMINDAVKMASGVSTRKAKDNLKKTFEPKKARQEILILNEELLAKLDRVRTCYGEDISNYELLGILLEEKLKTPAQPLRHRSHAAKNSRYIPVSVKHQVHQGKCIKCGTRRNLQYDHKLEFALGGDNSPSNILVLCFNCNQRKEIKRNQGLGPILRSSKFPSRSVKET